MATAFRNSLPTGFHAKLRTSETRCQNLWQGRVRPRVHISPSSGSRSTVRDGTPANIWVWTMCCPSITYGWVRLSPGREQGDTSSQAWSKASQASTPWRHRGGPTALVSRGLALWGKCECAGGVTESAASFCAATENILVLTVTLKYRLTTMRGSGKLVLAPLLSTWTSTTFCQVVRQLWRRTNITSVACYVFSVRSTCLWGVDWEQG